MANYPTMEELLLIHQLGLLHAPPQHPYELIGSEISCN
jgi:hypothetical protein